MTRPLRIELAGGLYHVTSRGDRREKIYENDKYRKECLIVLEKVCERFNWRCHAYCLMGNHYDFVIESTVKYRRAGLFLPLLCFQASLNSCYVKLS